MNSYYVYFQKHSLEIIAIIIAFIALIISIIAKHYAKKAFSLSLFDKRYKLYYDFKILVNKLLLNDSKSLHECLNEIKFLLWEAQYIFGNDVCNLLDQFKEHITGTILYYKIANDMADGRQPEDIDLVRKYKVNHYDPLQSLLSALMGENDLSNLNFYFHKYIADSDFKKPLSTGFFQCCRKR